MEWEISHSSFKYTSEVTWNQCPSDCCNNSLDQMIESDIDIYSQYRLGPSSRQNVSVRLASSSKNSVANASHHRLSLSWKQNIQSYTSEHPPLLYQCINSIVPVYQLYCTSVSILSYQCIHCIVKCISGNAEEETYIRSLLQPFVHFIDLELCITREVGCVSPRREGNRRWTWWHGTSQSRAWIVHWTHLLQHNCQTLWYLNCITVRDC